jgi:Tfp pilus assembly protein PilX
MTSAQSSFGARSRRRRGSVLIIVLWICLGLVVLVLYFADATNSELEASANRVGDSEARQAVAAGTRYAAYILNNYAIDGVVPDTGIAPDPTTDYHAAALRVGSEPGDPQFWFIGRDVNNAPTTGHDVRLRLGNRQLAHPAVAIRRRKLQQCVFLAQPSAPEQGCAL